MKAVEYDRYGGPEVLRLVDAPRPRPGQGELLVRVRAAALNPKDVMVRSGKFRVLSGSRFPKRVGFDWAGEIEEVGPGVTGVAPGSAWYGMLDGFQGGACAEYLVVRRDQAAPKPPSLGFPEAAAVPLAASTALQALRLVAKVKPGNRVLVNGASGGVGSFAIQIAKLSGAHVTATASAANLDLCRRLGADDALDYRAADPLSGGDRFDVVFDVFGNRSFGEARRALVKGGMFVSTVPAPRVFLATALTLLTRTRAAFVMVRARADSLERLAEYVDDGKLAPVVEHVFPLERIAEAEAQVGSKHNRGKVVVTIG
jgi:NADPH:quinone reductase-like Zn-dependent oxidoreductase